MVLLNAMKRGLLGGNLWVATVELTTRAANGTCGTSAPTTYVCRC